MKIEDVARAQQLIVERERVVMLRREAEVGKLAVWICGSPQPPALAEAARPSVLTEIDRQIGAIDAALRRLGVE